jgi:hypothetical protein
LHKEGNSFTIEHKISSNSPTSSIDIDTLAQQCANLNEDDSKRFNQLLLEYDLEKLPADAKEISWQQVDNLAYHCANFGETDSKRFNELLIEYDLQRLSEDTDRISLETPF